MKNVICLDFDDTLCDFDDRPIAGTHDALAALTGLGFDLVLSSARFAPLYGELNAMRMAKVARWCDEHALDIAEIALFVPAADLYVDDKGFGFDGWEHALAELRGTETINFALDGPIRAASGRPCDGAVEAIAELQAAGSRVVVTVCGAPEHDAPGAVREAAAWLGDHAITGHRVAAEKVAADVYVHAGGLRFTGNWPAVVERAKELVATLTRE